MAELSHNLNTNLKAIMTDTNHTITHTAQRVNPVSYDALMGMYGKLWRTEASKDDLIGYLDWMQDQLNKSESVNEKLERELINKTSFINQLHTDRVTIFDSLREFDLRLNPDHTVVKVDRVEPADHPAFRPITAWYKVIPGGDSEIEAFNHIENGHTDAKNPTLAGKFAAGKWVKKFKWLTALDVVVETDQV